MKDLLFDRLHVGLGRVLDLRSQQAAITSSNIANTDTPNYKAKFIRFDELLEQAVGNQDMALRRTDEAHIHGLFGDHENPEVEEMEAPSWVMDGNSVQLEREMVRLKSNAMQYAGVTRALNKRLVIMKYVVSQGKG